MRSLIFYLVIFLMVLWTTVMAADLLYGLLSRDDLVTAATGESPVPSAKTLLLDIRTGLWSPEAQARAVVWGIPMTVFSLIAAITQR